MRFRGLAKNTAHVVTLFALSNLWMARRQLMQLTGVVRPSADGHAVPPISKSGCPHFLISLVQTILVVSCHEGSARTSRTHCGEWPASTTCRCSVARVQASQC